MSVNQPTVPDDASLRAGRRSRNPQGQGGRLRAEIVGAADAILARTGDVGALSLRAVAREVGIATPSIYLHFPDKAALLHAVLDARFLELGAAVREAVLQEREPSARLRAGMLAYCRFGMAHPQAYRVLFGRAPAPLTPQPPLPHAGEGEPREGAGPTLHAGEGEPRDASVAGQATAGVPAVPRAGATAFEFLVTGVRECVAAGLAPPADPARVALNVWTALHGIVSLRASLPGFPWPPLTQQIDDLLHGLAGLRAAGRVDQE